MIVGYKVYLEELFEGFQAYWEKVKIADMISRILDKDISEMTSYSDKEYLSVINSAYLKGPFAMRQVLMPSELYNFLKHLREVFLEDFKTDGLVEYDIERVFSVDLSLDVESIISIMNLYGKGNKIVGMTMSDFELKFKNNVFGLWVQSNEQDKEMIEQLVRGKICLNSSKGYIVQS